MTAIGGGFGYTAFGPLKTVKEICLWVFMRAHSIIDKQKPNIYAACEALLDSHRPAKDMPNFSKVCLKTPKKSNA
jgi:hypothetical protein